jgi:hypothetical protein
VILKSLLLRVLPLSDETKADLVLEAENEIRAGVTPTRLEWWLMSTAERAARLVAGDRVRHEAAALVGLATASVEGLAEVAAGFDGGAAKKTLLQQQDQARLDAAVELARRGI